MTLRARSEGTDRMAAEARTLRAAMPRIRIGAPVSGPDYQSSDDIDDRLFQCVDRRHGALVLGPRRSGKSSLLRHTALRLAENHKRSTLIDLQGMRTPFSLLAELAPDRRRDFILNETEILRTESSTRIALDRLERGVGEALRHLETDVLMLDEVGMAVSTEHRELFSYTVALIAEAIERRGGACVMAAGGGELRVALARSEKLRQAVSRMERITIPPWPAAAVRNFVKARIGQLEPDRLDAVVKATSPGWPMEVATVAIAAFQETPDEPVDLVAERVAIDSMFILEQALATARQEEPRDFSPRLLEALASSEAPLSLVDVAKSLRLPPRRLLAPIEALSDLGIVTIESSRIDQDARGARISVATPMMARRINILFGTWRSPK